MNASPVCVDQRLSAVDSGEPQNVQPLSINSDRREQNPLWCLEEFDEPDVWTLASFDDLLPHWVA